MARPVDHPRPRTSRRAVTVALLGAVALVGASCSSDAGSDGAAAPTTSVATASTTAAAATTSSVPEAQAGPAEPVATPQGLGPHAVGRRTIEVTDASRDRTLNVDIWYPADAATAAGEPFTRYEFLPTAYVDSEVARDQPPVADGGPFPVLVYSHGSGGVSYAASFNMEHLASYGFVVAAPDHKGNTATDRVAGTADESDVVAHNRPLDVSVVLDEVLALGVADGDPFAGALDADRIGVFGHSFGGFTSLAVAGGFSNDLGEVPADDRVDAIAALAPYTDLLDDETFTGIEVPTLLMTGTKDDTTPIDPQTDRPWDLISAEPAFRVDLTDAGHQTLTDVCDYQQKIPQLPDAPQLVIDLIDQLAASGCGDGFMDHGRAKDLVNIYTTAFFLSTVAGDDTYAGVLTDAFARGASDLTFQARPAS